MFAVLLGTINDCEIRLNEIMQWNVRLAIDDVISVITQHYSDSIRSQVILNLMKMKIFKYACVHPHLCTQHKTSTPQTMV